MFPLIAALAIAAQAGPSDAPEAAPALHRVHVADREMWVWGVKRPSGKIRPVERRPDYRIDGVLAERTEADPEFRASDPETLARLKAEAEKSKPRQPEAPAEKAEGVIRDAAFRLVWNEVAPYVFAVALAFVALVVLLIRSMLRRT